MASVTKQGYYKFKLFIILLLTFYFIAGLSTEVFMPNNQKDFPPFFSWFLFDKVPNENSRPEYTIRIVEFQGKKIDPPILYEQAFGIIDNPTSPKARALVRNLGYNLERERDEEALRLRRLLEQIYLPPSVKYQVIILTYNPLQRLTSGEYQIRTLSEFQRQ